MRKILATLFIYGFKENAWEIKNGTSTNAPVDRNNNFYLQFTLGFGD